jgi:hypothetical protein
MRRLFWLGVGVAVGGLVVRKVLKTAESYGPQGLAESARASVGGVLETVREFAEDVRVAMAEREDELLAALATEGDVAGLLGEDDDDEAAGPGLR